MEKLEQAIARRHLVDSLDNNSAATTDLWNDEEIRIMQEEFTEQFYKEWKVGFDMYIKGNWEEAVPQLTHASSLGPGGVDGPSQSLLTFMKSKDGKAPIDWKGFRGFE